MDPFKLMLCILVFVALYAGYQWGKSADQRRRERERKRFWEAEQAKLPRAIRKS